MKVGLCTTHVRNLSMVNSTCAPIDMSSTVKTFESCAPVVHLCMIGITSQLLAWAVNSDDEEERASLAGPMMIATKVWERRWMIPVWNSKVRCNRQVDRYGSLEESAILNLVLRSLFLRIGSPGVISAVFMVTRTAFSGCIVLGRPWVLVSVLVFCVVCWRLLTSLLKSV